MKQVARDHQWLWCSDSLLSSGLITPQSKPLGEARPPKATGNQCLNFNVASLMHAIFIAFILVLSSPHDTLSRAQALRSDTWLDVGIASLWD